MKLTTRFFITLCFFFFSGYSHTYALWNDNGVLETNMSAVSDNARIHRLERTRAIKTNVSIPEVKESSQFDISIIEDEDNDPTSAKKYQQGNKDTYPYSYALTSGYLSGCIKKRLQLYEHFAFFPLPTYIRLCVIRI